MVSWLKTLLLNAGFLLLARSLTVAAQQRQQPRSGPPAVFRQPAEAAKLIKGTVRFSLDLFKQISEADQNVFFSPVSISLTMAMIYMGSRGNTSKQMKEVLGFAGVDDQHLHECFEDILSSLMQTDGKYTLRVANRLYGEIGHPFRQEFTNGTKRYYHAELESVNFGDVTTRKKINTWVEQQTNSKIKNILNKPLDHKTCFIVVNAIYFNGNWLNKFAANDTRNDMFHLSNGNTVNVDMMHIKTSGIYFVFSDLNCKVLKLPYEGQALSMAVLLPYHHQDLAALEAKLTTRHVQTIHAGKRGIKIEVSLPKFKLEERASLEGKLANLGITDVFNPRTADLSGIDGGRDLSVSTIVHKASIEVNEEGSEAAAATTITLTKSRFIQFRANHPFIFFIQDHRTGAILFMGKLENPVHVAAASDETYVSNQSIGIEQWRGTIGLAAILLTISFI